MKIEGLRDLQEKNEDDPKKANFSKKPSKKSLVYMVGKLNFM